MPGSREGDALSLSLAPELGASGHHLPLLTPRVQTRSLLPEPDVGALSSRKTQVGDRIEWPPAAAAKGADQLLPGTGVGINSLETAAQIGDGSPRQLSPASRGAQNALKRQNTGMG